MTDTNKQQNIPLFLPDFSLEIDGKKNYNKKW